MKRILLPLLLAASLTSCETVTKLSLRGAELSMRFEEKTGITPRQGYDLLSDWYAAYQANRAANRIAHDLAGSTTPPSK